MIANFIASQKGIKISNNMSLTEHFDTRGVFEKAEIGTPFPTIELNVNLKTDATPEQLNDLEQAVAKGCLICVILRRAGCEIVENRHVLET